jgi:multidrug efflux pump subunit AcrA (membrane-fusion protein)
VSTVDIQTAGRIGEMIEVVKGIAPGDRIVLKPSGKLRDGAAVSLSSK